MSDIEKIENNLKKTSTPSEHVHTITLLEFILQYTERATKFFLACDLIDVVTDFILYIDIAVN